MTSPGGWFGGFLDENSGGKPTTPTGSTRGPQPKNIPGLPIPGAGSGAGAASRPPVVTQEASPTGQTLYDALNMPDEWADDAYTMGVNDQGQLVRMTVAAGLEWFRNLAADPKSREEYNAWVVKLYDAKYLTEDDLRFNTYTSKVGQAFVEAAYDTAMTNLDTSHGGGVISLGDSLSQLAEGAAAIGGDGKKAPVRVDQQLDEQTLKDSLRDTARNVLGRALNDDEESRLVSRYRSAESAWNDANYNADVYGGTKISAPQPDALAKDALGEGSLGTEKAAQQLGGYAGVLMNMVGLGGSTSIGGTLG